MREVIFLHEDHLLEVAAAFPMDYEDKDLWAHAGAKYGYVKTPTPGMAEFLDIVRTRRAIVPADEYARLTMARWAAVDREWARRCHDREFARAMSSRCRHGFWAAGVDAHHAFALCVGSGLARRAWLSEQADTQFGVDMTVVAADGQEVAVAIRADTREAAFWERVKKGRHPPPSQPVLITVKTARHLRLQPSNKAWLTMADLAPLFIRLGVTPPEREPEFKLGQLTRPTRQRQGATPLTFGGVVAPVEDDW